jgi:hypothetical protein
LGEESEKEAEIDRRMSRLMYLFFGAGALLMAFLFFLLLTWGE